MREYLGKHSERAGGQRSDPDPDGSLPLDITPQDSEIVDVESVAGEADRSISPAPAPVGLGAGGVAGLPPAVLPANGAFAPVAPVAVLDAPSQPSPRPLTPPGVAEPWIIPAKAWQRPADIPPVAIATEARHRRLTPPLPSPVRETRYRARRWVRTAMFSLLILVLVGAGGAYGMWQYGEDVWKSIPREDAVSRDGVLDVPIANEPVTVMLVGSDSRDLEDPNAAKSFGSAAKVGGQRSDTIMLVHVDPQKDRSWVLSLPRDLKVDIPGHGVDKINASFNYGPDVLVETVKRFTGIPIHHYVEVNFESFSGIVDSLGGYDVHLERDTRDTVLLWKLAAGDHHLNGQETLQYVRARHMQERDPATSKWHGEGDGDMTRMKRQQEFLLNMASRLAGPGSLGNIGEYQNIAQQYLKLDPGFDFGTAIALFRAMTPLSPEKVELIQLPWGYETGKNGASLVVPTPEGMAKIAQLRSEVSGVDAAPGAVTPTAPGVAPAAPTAPPAPTPAQVTVKVLNASKNPGLASRVRVSLKAHGFNVVDIGDAPKKAAQTQILSAGGTNDLKANLVAQQLGYGQVAPGPAEGVDVVVMLGQDAPEPKS